MIRDLQIRYRQGTQDEMVIEEVILKNQYHLPDEISSEAVVLDIGAHIGAFAVACHQRGARHILSYEPDPENYALLFENTNRLQAGKLHGIKAYERAVWTEDGEITLRRSPNPLHTCCGTVVAEAGWVTGKPRPVKVLTRSFDGILQSAQEAKKRVAICKMDIEGAEWPLLWTSERLGAIDRLMVETHPSLNDAGFVIGKTLGLTKPTHENLVKVTVNRLMDAGFKADWKPQKNWENGFLFAERM